LKSQQCEPHTILRGSHAQIETLDIAACVFPAFREIYGVRISRA